MRHSRASEENGNRSEEEEMNHGNHRQQEEQKMEETTAQLRRVFPGAHLASGRGVSRILQHRETVGRRAIGGVPLEKAEAVEVREEEANHENDAPSLDGTKTHRVHLNSYPQSLSSELRNFAEYKSVTGFHSSYLANLNHDASSEEDHSAAVSTISIAMSPDAKTLASTHGDHTVKITCCATGKLIRHLEGHPRTPWTVKYHPLRPNIIASGCLGFQVRIWNWNHQRTTSSTNHNRGRKASTASTGTNSTDPINPLLDPSDYEEQNPLKPQNWKLQSVSGNYEDGVGVCLNLIRLQHPIISLSFHPSGLMLAIANGNSLHLWDYDDYGGRLRRQTEATAASSTASTVSTVVTGNVTPLSIPSRESQHQPGNSGTASNNASANPNVRGRGMMTELRHENALRCAHFPSGGNTIIVGGVNSPLPTSRSPANNPTSFSLRLWDFSLEAALDPSGTTPLSSPPIPSSLRPFGSDGTSSSTDSSNHHGSDTDGHVGSGSIASSILNRRIMERKRLQGRPGQPSMLRPVMTNSRIFVPRALLYNDGGFDVSPDGTMLCACAEYWLPDGVDNAMELIEQKEDELDDQDEEELIMAEKKNSEDERESNLSPLNGQDDAVDRRTPTNITGGVEDDSDDAEGDRKYENPTTPANSSVDGDDGGPSSSSSFHSPPRHGVGNATSSWIGSAEATPLTPPNATRQPMTLSPPSPPGRRWLGGLQQRLIARDTGGSNLGRGVRPIVGSPRPPVRRIRPNHHATPGGTSGSIPSSLRTPPPTSNPLAMIPPSPLEYQGGVGLETRRSGRYVPHVVIVSLNTLPLPNNSDGGDENGEVDDDTANVSGYQAQGANNNGNKRRRGRYQRPRLGQLLEACPLEEKKASGVTCVKFSPCANYCLLGYGVRESSLSPDDDNDGSPTLHPATALYRVQGGMTHVSSMLSADDDVNIARFHPDSGYGFVYGTKQGRVRILSPRPWNYYDRLPHT